MIGTVFLWLFWPSFNSAPAEPGIGMNRTVTNTVLSLTGSCVAAFLASYALRRERAFNMVDVQNATLAGGVAVGAVANLPILPAVALAIGTVAGIVSVAGYVYVQPWLEKKLTLRDTCGVHNLHGLPSLLGAFASSAAVALVPPNTVGASFTPGRDGAEVQLAYLFSTLGIALAGGWLTGLVCSLPLFGPLQDDVLFSDQTSWTTPSQETPYYHDNRGEVARGLANEVVQVEQEAVELQDAIAALAARVKRIENETPSNPLGASPAAGAAGAAAASSSSSSAAANSDMKAAAERAKAQSRAAAAANNKKKLAKKPQNRRPSRPVDHRVKP